MIGMTAMLSQSNDRRKSLKYSSDADVNGYGVLAIGHGLTMQLQQGGTRAGGRLSMQKK